MKKIILIISAVIIAAACIFTFSSLSYQINQSPCDYDDCSFVIDYEIKDGMTAKAVGRELKEKNIIFNDKLFYMFARFPGAAALLTNKPQKIFKIQKGYYELSSEMNLVQIFEEVSSGKEKTVTVSIPEGLTVLKIADRFEKAGFEKADLFVKEATKNGKQILNELNIDLQLDSVEGFLFPDTYSIPVTYNSKKIIVMMIKNLLKHLSQNEDTKSALDIPAKEFYSKLILASIVEREYRDPDEAGLIAGVFENRLSIDMPLQSCATVEYIITEINHKPHPKIIYYDDLESKSAYNTYKYPGLPPGPISNPGLTALKAAFRPEKSNYLYFTLTDADAGRHTFSSDLQSHNKATNEFKTKKAAGN
ncbi:MAG: endolytic transglycosylase MltG [Treponema sp.]|nr:endolytic transglycosylase MltG [Candidatus Treponema merdequi]